MNPAAKMNPEKMQPGYTCLCGEYHGFGMWVAAHWHEVLTNTCGACNRTNTLKEGQVLKWGELVDEHSSQGPQE